MQYIPVAANIVALGNMCVDIFLLLSGISLSASADKRRYEETGWKLYYQRRFNRVLIPYMIIAVPYYLWNCLVEQSGGIVRRIIIFAANLSSASFWLKGMQTTWYVYAIIVFYLFFPAIYRLAKNQKLLSKTIALACMIVFAIASSYVPVLKNSMIVWARLPIFTLGVMLGVSGREDLPKTGTLDKALAFVFVIAAGWFISSCEILEIFKLPQVYRLLMYLPMTYWIVRFQAGINWENRLWSWIGGMSLEIYLIHITLLHPIKHYGIMDMLGNWLYLFLPVVSILLACAVVRIEGVILRKLA